MPKQYGTWPIDRDMYKKPVKTAMRSTAKELVCEECGNTFIHKKCGHPKYCPVCRAERL